MRTSVKVVGAIALAVLATNHAADAKGRRQQQQPEARAEDTAKKKALDADYKKALNSVPDSKDKDDPWKSMR